MTTTRQVRVLRLEFNGRTAAKFTECPDCFCLCLDEKLEEHQQRAHGDTVLSRG